MRLKLLLAALLALPLLVVALAYGRSLLQCHHPVATDDPDKSDCCQPDKSDCCQKDCCEPPTSLRVQGNDPDKQIVFKVDGLACAAVKGIGCGHMLRPVLASLDKIDGVEASSANYTGTMIRVSVTTATDRDKFAEQLRKALAEEDRKPVALAGEELKVALEKEQWRQAGQIGELSAIEFRTLALHWVKSFAKAEKLDKEATDKLLKMTEDQWERIEAEAAKAKGNTPDDWLDRCKQSIPQFLEQTKEVLTTEQVERFKKVLGTPCRDEDRPEAPPAPATAKAP